MGLRDIAGYLAGGMTSWREERRPVATVARMTVPELHERWEGGDRPQVLDVRERSEWDAGHIPGSVFVPYHDIRTACRRASTRAGPSRSSAAPASAPRSPRACSSATARGTSSTSWTAACRCGSAAAGPWSADRGDVLRVAHTSELEPALLEALHAMLVEVFEGDFDAHDWEHALGGVHAIAYQDGELAGHASVVQRRLLHDGRALRAGYVEAVGVRREARRRGHASALMEVIERVIRGAYEVGALGASDAAIPLYGARGWRPWQGETYALGPDGPVRTPEDDDSLYVLELAAPLDRSGAIACDWREGAVW